MFGFTHFLGGVHRNSSIGGCANGTPKIQNCYYTLKLHKYFKSNLEKLIQILPICPEVQCHLARQQVGLHI
jgi:hypothetical protein